jgi:hypothetical protein
MSCLLGLHLKKRDTSYFIVRNNAWKLELKNKGYFFSVTRSLSLPCRLKTDFSTCLDVFIIHAVWLLLYNDISSKFYSHFNLWMYLSLPAVRSSSVTIIPSKVHTHLHINTTAIKRKTVKCLGTFKQSNTLLCNRIIGKEKCFHVVCLQVMLVLIMVYKIKKINRFNFRVLLLY